MKKFDVFVMKIVIDRKNKDKENIYFF